MFTALVIMLPLFCLTLAAALEELLKKPFEGPELGRFLRNIATAGVLLSLLPPATEQGHVLRPLFDISLMLALAGGILIRAGQSPLPRVWFALSAFGSVATLSVWMIAPL